MSALPLRSTGAWFLWDTVRYFVNCISELFHWKADILGYLSSNFYHSVVEGYFWGIRSAADILAWAEHVLIGRECTQTGSRQLVGVLFCRRSLEGKGPEARVQMAFAIELCGVFCFPIFNIVRHYYKTLQSCYSYYLSVRNFIYVFMYLFIYLYQSGNIYLIYWFHSFKQWEQNVNRG